MAYRGQNTHVKFIGKPPPKRCSHCGGWGVGVVMAAKEGLGRRVEIT